LNLLRNPTLMCLKQSKKRKLMLTCLTLQVNMTKSVTMKMKLLHQSSDHHLLELQIIQFVLKNINIANVMVLSTTVKITEEEEDGPREMPTDRSIAATGSLEIHGEEFSRSVDAKLEELSPNLLLTEFVPRSTSTAHVTVPFTTERMAHGSKEPSLGPPTAQTEFSEIHW